MGDQDLLFGLFLGVACLVVGIAILRNPRWIHEHARGRYEAQSLPPGHWLARLMKHEMQERSYLLFARVLGVWFVICGTVILAATAADIWRLR